MNGSENSDLTPALSPRERENRLPISAERVEEMIFEAGHIIGLILRRQDQWALLIQDAVFFKDALPDFRYLEHLWIIAEAAEKLRECK